MTDSPANYGYRPLTRMTSGLSGRFWSILECMDVLQCYAGCNPGPG